MLSQVRIIFTILVLLVFSCILMKYAIKYYNHSIQLRKSAQNNYFSNASDINKWKLANGLFRASQFFGLIAIIQLLVAIAISTQLIL